MKNARIIVLLLLSFGTGLAIGALVLHHMPPPATGESRAIYPSIFITGSSGKASSMDPMVAGIVSDPATKAHRGLVMVVEANGSLKVTGSIDRKNRYPTVEVGMAKGTNNSLKYESALKTVMSYLGKHYNIPYANVMGYSAGGSGVYRYLLEYGYDRSLPPVKKWISLDGQYNASTAQKSQTLDEVLRDGPDKQTSYYKYWTQNYQRLDKHVQVMLLAGDYDSSAQSDGVVPWADTFSIYPLLRKNGNTVSYHLIKGADTEHEEMPKNKEAIDLVKIFLYE